LKLSLNLRPRLLQGSLALRRTFTILALRCSLSGCRSRIPTSNPTETPANRSRPDTLAGKSTTDVLGLNHGLSTLRHGHLSRALTLLHGNKGPTVSAIFDWSATTPMLVVQRNGLPTIQSYQ
jgi:hypothetical protein